MPAIPQFGERPKVGLDAFKLVTVGRSRPQAQLILAFADDEAAAYARGKGWLAGKTRPSKVTAAKALGTLVTIALNCSSLSRSDSR